MLLIVGLGNPGKKYQSTRHNVGFMAVDEIAEKYEFSDYQKKFQGLFAQGEVNGANAIILKPQTYMNKSGSSVAEAAGFYKIPPENVIVLYDEIDLIPGKVRVKQGGGSGGHNGIRSMDAHIGNNYWRVRVGVGHPGDKDMVTDYVLGKFTSQDKKVINNVIEAMAQALPLLADGAYEKFMTKVALLAGK